MITPTTPTATAPVRPQHEIRADHTDTTITVYQAYSPSLGRPAARDGRFPEAWKRDRMTWIKPSFLWMMYRCGWATKEGQETVLAVEITREGFDWALDHSELSHYVGGVHADRAAWQRSLRRSPARVQWDPERDLRLNRLPYRSLQLGLSGEASRRYADEWTVSIRDVTPLARRIHEHVTAGRLEAAAELLPRELPYPATATANGTATATATANGTATATATANGTATATANGTATATANGAASAGATADQWATHDPASVTDPPGGAVARIE